VEAKFEERASAYRRLERAASGPLKTQLASIRAANDRYHGRFMEERKDAGGGEPLAKRAANAGFYDTRDYIDSLTFDDPSAQSRKTREVTARLAEVCDDVTPPDPGLLDAGAAPPGVILAVKLGTGEIHRFSTTGVDLGSLELPSEVEAPIRYVTLAPDGHRLAFLSGSNPSRLWVVDLVSNASTELASPTCMDWDDTGTGLWELLGPPSDQVITHVGLDGTVDSQSSIRLGGCPSRFSADLLAVARRPVDGAPIEIELVPKSGGEATTLVSSRCHLVDPQLSQDARRVLLTVGCWSDAKSGVFRRRGWVRSSTTDAGGSRGRHVVARRLLVRVRRLFA
jgi:hypothetical protein